ncbi:MAG: hypothetical protein VCF24_09045 [Candidatus Latescibacterota bacterium]|jgi:hypothetical protein
MTYLPFPRLWTHVALVAVLGSAAGAHSDFLRGYLPLAMSPWRCP